MKQQSSFVCIELKKHIHKVYAYGHFIAGDTCPVPTRTLKATQNACVCLTELAATMNSESTPEATQISQLAENTREDLIQNY